jgi:hypothetical protein
MDKPRLYVDFNEMLEPGLYLLSRTDTTQDSAGNSIELADGRPVAVYMDDDGGALIADGVVERNEQHGRSAHVKWCCRIDQTGIRRWEPR